MRGRFSLALFAGLLVASTGIAQDGDLPTRYWPTRKIDFPLNKGTLAQLPEKPTEFRLYVASNGGGLKLGPRFDSDKLPTLPNGNNYFPFDADRDGDYEFAVQFVYPSRTVSPRTEDLRPEWRVVVDSIPPDVQIAAAGNGVSWKATDENLDPRSIALQCKRPGGAKWFTVDTRNFTAADRYAWQLGPTDTLDVRVVAKDKAGHEGVSRVVRVPADGVAGSGVGRDPLDRDPPFTNRGGSGLGSVGDLSPRGQAPIFYVNKLTFDVETTINRVSRSGVKAAHLFVSDDQRVWKSAGDPTKLNIRPEDGDQVVHIPFTVRDQGLYSFIVIPESGAGKRAPNPAKDAPPMVMVEVDTKEPYARVTSVEVLPGDARGPRVDITYEVGDRNLMPKPVSLEYSPDPKATVWQPIALQIDNFLGAGAARDPDKKVGRYTWYVGDDKPWKFYVRVRAVDKAANTGEWIYRGENADASAPPKEVMVDLDKPEAAVRAVQTGPGSGGNGSAPRPVPVPVPSGGTPSVPSVPLPGGGGGPELPPLP